MTNKDKLEDSTLDAVAGGSGSRRWSVRCGTCNSIYSTTSDKLQAEGTSNNLIINRRVCPRCNSVSWFVHQD